MDRMVLRRWKNQPQTVIAFLPDVPANPGRVMAYEHVGQHGEADYSGLLGETAPATVAEYDAAGLVAELRMRGHEPRILKRMPRAQR